MERRGTARIPDDVELRIAAGYRWRTERERESVRGCEREGRSDRGVNRGRGKEKQGENQGEDAASKEEAEKITIKDDVGGNGRIGKRINGGGKTME